MALAPDGVAGELWVADGSPGLVGELEGRYPEAMVRVQPEGSLGARLRTAFASAFGDGVEYAVAVGSDHPTLPAAYLRTAFQLLESVELVIGPASDGGYYAIGVRRSAWGVARGVFEGAPWSKPNLLEWVRSRAGDIGIACAELPSWYDVDWPEDLARMEKDLIEGSATAAAWAELRGKSAGGPQGPVS